MNGIIRMIVRLVLLNGVRQGIDWFFERRADRHADSEMSPEQRKDLQSQSRQQAKTTKRGFRLLRRFMRF